MSGGYFNYKQYHITDIVDEIQKYDFSKYSQCTRDKISTAVTVLQGAAIYAQRIDWLISSDDSEKTFNTRLIEELPHGLKIKPLVWSEIININNPSYPNNVPRAFIKVNTPVGEYTIVWKLVNTVEFNIWLENTYQSSVASLEEAKSVVDTKLNDILFGLLN